MTDYYTCSFDDYDALESYVIFEDIRPDEGFLTQGMNAGETRVHIEVAYPSVRYTETAHKN
jgi:hypothetical protein